MRKCHFSYLIFYDYKYHSHSYCATHILFTHRFHVGFRWPGLGAIHLLSTSTYLSTELYLLLTLSWNWFVLWTSCSLFNFICWHKFNTPLSYCPIVSLLFISSNTSSTLPHILYSLFLLYFLILILPPIPPHTPTPTPTPAPAHFFPFSTLLLLLLFPPSLSSSSYCLIQFPLLFFPPTPFLPSFFGLPPPTASLNFLYFSLLCLSHWQARYLVDHDPSLPIWQVIADPNSYTFLSVFKWHLLHFLNLFLWHFIEFLWLFYTVYKDTLFRSTVDW